MFIENGAADDVEGEESEDDEDEVEDIINIIKTRRMGNEEISKCLADTSFKYKISFLYDLINRVNGYSTRLQSQTLLISEMKTELFTCYNEFAKFIFDPLDINENTFFQRIELDFKKKDVQTRWIMADATFIAQVSKTAKFSGLRLKSFEEQTDFAKTFKPFLTSILGYFSKYFPLKDKIVHTLDFLELVDSSYMSLEDKIRYFATYFKLVPEDKQEELDSELTKLTQKQGYYLMLKGRDPDLKITFDTIWGMIEHNDGLKLIASIAKAAKALPVSSASVEQTFSVLKLIKTHARNQLSQESLEALILIHDATVDGKLKITSQMVTDLDRVKSELNLRKKPMKRIFKKIKTKGDSEIPPERNQTTKKVLVEKKATTGVNAC